MDKRLPGRIAGRICVVRLAAVLIGCLALTGCPDLTQEACERDSTAEVAFRNTNSTITARIIWDGLNIGTLAPGQTGLGRTVSAGMHTLQFQNNSGGAALCAPSTPSPAQCTSTTYIC